MIIFTFVLKCFDRNFSSSLFALLSLAGFFRKTFWILPSMLVCITCFFEFGWTLIWSFILTCHNFYSVSVFQWMVFADELFCSDVDCFYEFVTDVCVEMICEVEGC